MSAWKADALPLGDARMQVNFTSTHVYGQVRCYSIDKTSHASNKQLESRKKDQLKVALDFAEKFL
jgi:hypothetical protein